MPTPYGAYDNFLADSEFNDTYNQIQPFAGDTPAVVTHPAIIAQSGQLAAGTVLGQITASGVYAPLNPTASDGSQKAAAILCNDIDTTAGQMSCDVYLAGCFNTAWLTFPSALTAAQIQVALVGTMLVHRFLYWSSTP